MVPQEVVHARKGQNFKLKGTFRDRVGVNAKSSEEVCDELKLAVGSAGEPLKTSLMNPAHQIGPKKQWARKRTASMGCRPLCEGNHVVTMLMGLRTEDRWF